MNTAGKAACSRAVNGVSTAYVPLNCVHCIIPAGSVVEGSLLQTSQTMVSGSVSRGGT